MRIRESILSGLGRGCPGGRRSQPAIPLTSRSISQARRVVNDSSRLSIDIPSDIMRPILASVPTEAFSVGVISDITAKEIGLYTLLSHRNLKESIR